MYFLRYKRTFKTDNLSHWIKHSILAKAYMCARDWENKLSTGTII